MKEVKIQIPDNCELVKDGDSYVVREKQNPPRSWKEFCERYPIGENEVYFSPDGEIRLNITAIGQTRTTSKWMINKQEAEAFLALMQLRQLRKAWVGDWEQPSSKTHIAVITYNINNKKIGVDSGDYWSNVVLSFPTKEMAVDFLSCFSDLCETAKNLL